MYKTIIVPLDGSDLAENALVYAKQIAEMDESKLVLARASGTVETIFDLFGEVSYPVITTEQLLGSAEQYLSFIRTSHTIPDAVIHVRTGRPANIILNCEQAQDADLIVMSTHGRSGVTRWALGSVASKVLQRSQVPLLLVRDRRPIERILVPLDGSINAEAIMPHAVHLALVFGASLTLLRVGEEAQTATPRRAVATMVRDAISAIPPAIIEPDQEERYLDSVWRELPRAIEATTLERTGAVAETILAVAKDHDLIAMSTHGYSGVQRYLFGSVMEKVLRATDRPMLIVRPWL